MINSVRQAFIFSFFHSFLPPHLQVLASLGGIQFSYFEPFLESEDELVRCAAAEQLVILAKVTASAE